MRGIAAVSWSGHNQWAFVQDGTVLICVELVGELEPKRIYAWQLTTLANYEQVLLVLLQKFHATAKQNLPDVVRTIIIVQNAFVKAVSPPESPEETVYDTEDAS